MFALIRIKQLELRIKLFVFCVLSIILYSLFFIHTVHAASSIPTASPSALPVTTPIPYTLNPIPSSVSPTSPLYTDLFVHNMFHSFSCLAIGQSVIGQPCLSYQITKNAQGMLEGVPVLSQSNLSGGALGATTSLIGAMYKNPPVRTADYLASVGQGLGIVREANAQVIGSGEEVLNPILRLWVVSRNISYVIIIIIFLIIGLMVMFRNKINPQTVITAQAALPGLVIGLIMITFSYFFAGLISDMAFVGTNIVGYYFAAAQGPTALADPDRTNLVEKISRTNVLKIFGNFVGIATKERASNVYNLIFNELSPEVQSTIRWFVGFMGFQMVGPLGGIAGPYSAIAAPIIGIIGGTAAAFDAFGMVGFILHFVATFILIFAMLKLLLRLINSYLTIVFLTISAPFQFLFASLPGRQGIATGWILNMLANILVFPTVIAVFYFVAVLMAPLEPRLREPAFPLKVSGVNQIQNNDFIPIVSAQEQQDQIDVVNSKVFPLFGGMDLDFIKILLAFGALVALPSIPDIIIRSVGRAGQAGQLIGQEISGNIRSGQGYASQYGGRITQAGQSLFTGVAGESTIVPLPGGGFARKPVKYGLWHIFRK